MGIEPTTRFERVTGFEDRGDHQAPFVSNVSARRSHEASTVRNKYEIVNMSLPSILYGRNSFFALTITTNVGIK
jgi:hypothetical protein